MLCVDDFSQMTWVFFFKSKSEALEYFKQFKILAENQVGCTMKAMRSYRRDEFTSQEFTIFCEANRI